ncbi:LysR family transcriptional regulator [Sinorhizobium meliloti]|uniref:LysR family transcriptional regulator n=1 Tax=Rhizobium meliloti TaxID=382 RepID=UPI001F46AFB7|nr:LysR family transcriptional regulator [Sinorhizobium meliloti]
MMVIDRINGAILRRRFRWRLDWNLLRTFIVVVEQSGVTGAAEFRNLSQPTTGRALKGLEETTEKYLLDRRPGHLALTSVGESLYRESLMIIGSISRLPGLMAMGTLGKEGTVRQKYQHKDAVCYLVCDFKVGGHPRCHPTCSTCKVLE